MQEKNSIEFFNEHPSFKWRMPSKLISFLQKSIIATKQWIDFDLRYIFLTDKDLLAINQEYLDHDYYTDIITFDLSPNPEQLEADIYISIDRVRDNAKEYEVAFDEEILRVIFHGLLHLIGFDDNTEEEEKNMRLQEQAFINSYKQSLI